MGTWWLIGLALGVGAFAAVQAGANARLSEVTKTPVAAGLLTAVVAVLAMLAVFAATRSPVPSRTDLASAPWWAWVGGLAGAAYVLVAIVAAKPLGAVALAGFVVCGQLVASVVLDHFGLVGFEQRPVNLVRLLGVALLLAGVYLVHKF
jgi:transporter family-2 protein